MNPLIAASVVYDGGERVVVPGQMGAPNADQLAGTPLENLCELACRICYDSLGAAKSRSSVAMHQHLKEVGHLSVYEHANLTFELSRAVISGESGIGVLVNRPGVWVNLEDGNGDPRFTANLRAILEWDSWSARSVPMRWSGYAASVGYILKKLAHARCPLVVANPATAAPYAQAMPEWYATVVEPRSDDERWVSMFVSGSRGLSHELVRHGDHTAISQRSTRYVDEDGSPWVEHPLTSNYLASADAVVRASNGEQTELSLAQLTGHTQRTAARTYKDTVLALEPWLIARGIDKFTARKQARGAARGYLGNALYTELVFSASVAQWKWIIRQRASAAADAEIREMACKALLALKASRYRDSFDAMYLAPSPDGIGQVLTEAADVPEA